MDELEVVLKLLGVHDVFELGQGLDRLVHVGLDFLHLFHRGVSLAPLVVVKLDPVGRAPQHVDAP